VSDIVLTEEELELLRLALSDSHGTLCLIKCRLCKGEGCGYCDDEGKYWVRKDDMLDNDTQLDWRQ